MPTPKSRLKTFFKNKTMSAAGVEFLRFFLLPFLRKYNVPENKKTLNIDESIAAWFNTDKRTIVSATARKKFRMPGYMALASGGKWTARVSNRWVESGQRMLLVIDTKDQTTKIDVVIDGKERLFKLSRAETEFLKDQVTWHE